MFSEVFEGVFGGAAWLAGFGGGVVDADPGGVADGVPGLDAVGVGGGGEEAGVSEFNLYSLVHVFVGGVEGGWGGIFFGGGGGGGGLRGFGGGGGRCVGVVFVG